MSKGRVNVNRNNEGTVNSRLSLMMHRVTKCDLHWLQLKDMLMLTGIMKEQLIQDCF